MKKGRNFGICTDFTKTMISKITTTHDIPSTWRLVERDELDIMSQSSISTIYIIFRREVRGITSFITHSYDVRTDWLNDKLARHMARVVKDFYNLKEWETVCYYYHKS